MLGAKGRKGSRTLVKDIGRLPVSDPATVKWLRSAMRFQSVALILPPVDVLSERRCRKDPFVLVTRQYNP
jgi:hypothetical protein